MPAAVREFFDRVRERGAAQQGEWEALWEGYRTHYLDLAAQWELLVNGELPGGWEAALPSFEGKALATRAPNKASP